MLYRCGTLDSHMVIAEDSNSGRSSLSVGPFWTQDRVPICS
jgi:hypothetical protein